MCTVIFEILRIIRISPCKLQVSFKAAATETTFANMCHRMCVCVTLSMCVECVCVYPFTSVCVCRMCVYVCYIHSSVCLCAVLVCTGYGLDIFITKEGRLTLTV